MSENSLFFRWSQICIFISSSLRFRKWKLKVKTEINLWQKFNHSNNRERIKYTNWNRSKNFLYSFHVNREKERPKQRKTERSYMWGSVDFYFDIHHFMIKLEKNERFRFSLCKKNEAILLWWRRNTRFKPSLFCMNCAMESHRFCHFRELHSEAE